MRMAITGASGLVGGNLAALLVGDGHDVTCTKRPGSRVAHLGHLAVRWTDAELADVSALASAFEGAQVVFHCAAAVGIAPTVTKELEETNVVGTRHVIDAVRRAGVRRLVHCSTTAAVGLSVDGADVDETARWNFAELGLADGYAITKRDAEDVVRGAVRDGLDAVIVNPTYMFGPYDARPSSGKMLIDVVRRQMSGGTPGVNNFVDVRDVVRGMWAAAEKGRTGERYILGGENWTYFEAFTRIARTAGVRPPRFVVPWPVAATVGKIGDLGRVMGRDTIVHSLSVKWAYCTRFRFTSRKAETELGYRHGPPEEGIRAALEWFRANGMLPPAGGGG
ncbi:MAG: NAD-dependent epimerase/dehydratase family protein [Deltaproteobacteria bacterium]|nr:NAD-dependent epimerase/dehydratase family protein [Deltaproteobacteria bacterium]